MTIKHGRLVEEQRRMADTKGRPAGEQQLKADKKRPKRVAQDDKQK